MRPALPFLLLCACAPTENIYVAQPWSHEQTVVLLVLSEDGDPLAAPRVTQGRVVSLEVKADPPYRLVADVYPDLDPACTVTYEGTEGAVLPPPEQRFAATVEDPGSIELQPTDTAPNYTLRTDCPLHVCPQITEQVQTLEEIDTTIADVLLLAEDDFLVAAGGGPLPKLLRVQGDTRSLVPLPNVEGGLRSLAWEGERILGATTDMVFRWDPVSGAVESEPTLAEARGAVPVPGGAPLVYGPFGVREAFAPTGTTSVERLDGNPKHLVLGDRGDALAIDDESSTVYHYQGGNWTREMPEPGALGLSSFRRAAAGLGDFMAVGLRENVFTRRDNDWIALEHPFDTGVDFDDVTSFADGSYLVVGNAGSLAIWDGVAWCTARANTRLTLKRVASLRSGRTALAGSGLDGMTTHPEMVLITLSD